MIEFFIRRKVFVSMLFIGLTLLGLVSYRQLPVELLPSTELPFLIVQVNSTAEAEAERMEKEAIIPLEGAVGTLEGIENIESFADRRQGRIFVYYNNDVNVKYAYLKLQEKVDAVKGSLPDNYFVVVVKIDTEQLSNMFMNLQVRGSGDVDQVRAFVDNKITREFQAVDGIAHVEVFGGRQKTIEVTLRPGATESYRITPSRIRNAIAQYGSEKIHLGQIEEGYRKTFVNLQGEYTSVTELEQIVLDANGPVLLGDVADVRFDVKDEETISRVNGKESVTLQLVRDSQVNLLNLSARTYPLIEKLNNRYADQGIEIAIQYDSAEMLRENVDLIIQLAVSGAIVAVIVLWYFLQNLRLISIIAVSLPVSIYTALNFFYAFDISLNSLTLVGMALAVGMLLDNSIVVLENIYRLRRKKLPALTAVVQGVQEVWRPILAATLTTVCVFVPFLFADDFFVKLLGYQIGVSIISTLLVSMVVALLFVPMVTFQNIKRGGGTVERFQRMPFDNPVLVRYRVLLKAALRFPVRTIISAVVVFFASLLITMLFSLTELQEEVSTEFTIYLTMQGGSTLQSTDKAVAELEEALAEIPEIAEKVSQVYEEEAIVTIKLDEEVSAETGRGLDKVKEDIQERTNDYRAAVISFDPPASSNRFRQREERDGGMGRFLGVGATSEKIILKGQDLARLYRMADDLEFQVKSLPSVRTSWTSIGSGRPEVQLFFDDRQLSGLNIGLNNIANELNAFRKEFSSGVQFKDESGIYDIIILNPEYEEPDSRDLKNLLIHGNTGSTVPLYQISNMIYSEGTPSIRRINQERQVEVQYRFVSEVSEVSQALEQARAEVDQLVASLELPAGIAAEVVHDETDLSDFYFLFAVGSLMIYMILASVFESLLNPLVIMFTIPLAGIGSFLAIMLTGHSLLNANTMVGFLILLGIVVNNGILMIDYTRLLQRRGYRIQRALISAGQARLRPIVITAITTIAGMFPLAMGQADYVTRIAAPFAVTVIGGLAFSTVFTLVLIPTVYSGLNDFVKWIRELPLYLRITQLLLVFAGAWLIYEKVDSIVWRFADFSLVLFVVPALTWFVRSSLRKASTTLFAPEEKIKIQVRNLHKIYQQPGRFVREWNRVTGELHAFADRHVLLERSWQFILFLFTVYFVYFYLDSHWWRFVLVHLPFLHGIYLLRRFNLPARLLSYLYWIIPLANLVWFTLTWESITAMVLVGVLWALLLMLYLTRQRLESGKVIPAQIRGRFAGLRRRYYSMISSLPLIGAKKKKVHALSGVSLEIGQGMFGLLGPNGAGKTTLMRVICGIFDQTYGTVYFNDIDSREKREELQGIIGYLPQEFGTYENMTARQFLEYQAILKGFYQKEARDERIEYVLNAVNLGERADENIGSFSGGMKQRIGIAQTLLHLPRILVVDEPTAGLDPRERIRFRNLLVELSRERIVIFSTHVIEDVATACDRVAVLSRGAVRFTGKPEQMVRQANGKVWQCLLSHEEFESMRDSRSVIHHIIVGDKIRVRILGNACPHPAAKEVTPTLEDAYLWLERQGDE